MQLAVLLKLIQHNNRLQPIWLTEGAGRGIGVFLAYSEGPTLLARQPHMSLLNLFIADKLPR